MDLPHDSGLPASRTDALSIVALGLFSALIGATPAKGKKIPLILSTLANIWSIVSSIITLREIWGNPHEIETWLWFFLFTLLVSTILSSAATLIWYVVGEDGGKSCLCFGLLIMFGFFVGGLVELVMAYVEDCSSPDFEDAALCDHSTDYVVCAVVASGLAGLVLGAFIIWMTTTHAKGACVGCCTSDSSNYVAVNDPDEHKAHSEAGAILSRTNALAKALLLGVYWFLVDADLDWDFTINGQDTSWWVTGQWSKQVVSVANIFLNAWCWLFLALWTSNGRLLDINRE